jgi:hypothetical protein
MHNAISQHLGKPGLTSESTFNYGARPMTRNLIAVLVVLASAGCGVEHNSTCVAGSSQSCACSNGASGAQECGNNGAYGPCSCTGSGNPGNSNPGSSYLYSFGGDIQRTNWSAGWEPVDVAESLCQTLFLSNGIYGVADEFAVRGLGTDCTQLKENGPGTTGSTSTFWGATSSSDTMTNSACPTGQIAIGVAYAANNDGTGGYLGVGALCADFASWADPAASVQPAVAPQVVGTSSNLSLQVTCAQGYALVGLEGYQSDGEVSEKITIFRGVCNSIYRTAQ